MVYNNNNYNNNINELYNTNDTNNNYKYMSMINIMWMI